MAQRRSRWLLAGSSVGAPGQGDVTVFTGILDTFNLSVFTAILDTFNHCSPMRRSI